MELALSNEQRQELMMRLSQAIEQSGLDLDEFVFTTADLLRSTFWISQTAQKVDADVELMKERITNAINGIIEILKENTETVAEDIIVLSTIMLEAANQVMLTRQQKEANLQEENGEEPVE